MTPPKPAAPEPPNAPQPPAEAAALSRRLSAMIATEIQRGGPISFERFMQRALYEPGLGYYSAGLAKFGEAGDFITAPELGPVFANCLARQAAQVLEAVSEGVILEIGAGSGVLARDMLRALARGGSLPTEYWILETSGDLRQRQRECLEDAAPVPVRWLDRPPSSQFSGLIVANEVIDALPVRCFAYCDGTLHERCVGVHEDGFGWSDQPAGEELSRQVARRLPDAPSDYRSEYCPSLQAWIGGLVEHFERGVMLFIDYGYPRAEYYHPERDGGTLICHHRHRAHDNPFHRVGLTDISAFVDFTALAEAGDAHAMTLLGYASQADFLLNCGLDEELNDLMQQADLERLAGSAAVRRLTMPSEMGEKFKAMALGRSYQRPLRGFASGDRRGRL